MNLDCETRDIAEQSIATILQMEQVQLRERICAIKKTDFATNTCIVTDRWLPMLNAVAGRKISDLDDGNTCWFHATRVKDLSSFRQGILPLSKNLNRIWDMLYLVVADCVTLEGWEKFHQETVADNYGGHSEEVVNAWMSNEGPYAFLFPESTLTPGDFCCHDYFSSSELIEWIAICFKCRFGVSLHNRHHAATMPGLIKFWTPGVKAMHLGATVDYLLHRHFGWSLSSVDPCFSAEGKQIDPAQVIKFIPILERIHAFARHPLYSPSPPANHLSLGD